MNSSKQKEVEIIEKWYPQELTEKEKRLKKRSTSLHNFQLNIALRRMWESSTISNSITKYINSKRI